MAGFGTTATRFDLGLVTVTASILRVTVPPPNIGRTLVLELVCRSEIRVDGHEAPTIFAGGAPVCQRRNAASVRGSQQLVTHARHIDNLMAALVPDANLRAPDERRRLRLPQPKTSSKNEKSLDVALTHLIQAWREPFHNRPGRYK